MTKFLFLISTVLLSLTAQAQSFGIPMKDHPFYSIIEWKGKGGLLMSQNPKVEMKQIGLTLVGENDEGIWDQKFNPKVRTPMYLFNEDTRHVYFIDHLDLVDNGRVTFNQLNAAGSARSKVLDIGAKVKLLANKPDYTKFYGVDAAVTEKVLVYQYRLYNKKEKRYEDYAAFITHHNFAPIVLELGSVDATDFKNGNDGLWKFAGYKGEVIYFARSRFKFGVHGWTVKGFSYKGVTVEDHFITKPDDLLTFRNVSYGNTGSYYLEDEKLQTMESGLISFMNGNFYLTVVQKRNDGHDLVLFQAEDSEWIEVNSLTLDPINEEEEVKLGTFPIHEGITYHYTHGGVDKVGILLFEEGAVGSQYDFTEHSVFNPSALIIEHTSEEFVTQLPSAKTIVCNRTQFGRSSGISLEHR
ncbi:MAG: hypothetical protein QNK23_02095 [Crocinitomicaceae bacterium]|nr:hypothetical protein [Crocinitomicaceae bacterium]